MNRLDLFPTEVFWWDWESEVDHLVEASKKYVSTDIPVDQSNSDLHTKPEYRELFTWITKCANEIKEYYQFHCESFKITTAWVNRVTSKQDIHFHRHPMSAYSGVFYLTGGSPLCFRQPNPLQVHKSTIPISDINKDMYMVEPIKGRLIMFLNTANAYHDVTLMKNSTTKRHFIYGGFSLSSDLFSLARLNSSSQSPTNFVLYRQQ